MGGHTQDFWGLSSWLISPLEEMALRAHVPSLELSSALEVIFPIGGTSPAPQGPLSNSMFGPTNGIPHF